LSPAGHSLYLSQDFIPLSPPRSIGGFRVSPRQAFLEMRKVYLSPSPLWKSILVALLSLVLFLCVWSTKWSWPFLDSLKVVLREPAIFLFQVAAPLPSNALVHIKESEFPPSFRLPPSISLVADFALPRLNSLQSSAQGHFRLVPVVVEEAILEPFFPLLRGDVSNFCVSFFPSHSLACVLFYGNSRGSL